MTALTTSQVSTVIQDPASVDAAIESRFSARAFLPRPVEREVLAEVGSRLAINIEIKFDVPRWWGLEIVTHVAEVLAAAGLSPLLCQRDAPTPVIAHTIRKRRAIGGINMTALPLTAANTPNLSAAVVQPDERIELVASRLGVR